MEMSDGKSNRKGTPNKRWEEDMTIELISFLAEVVKSGSKSDKFFKKSQMLEAADHINAKFPKAKISWINVDSRLRTLKGWHKEIKGVFELSGTGWDENAKMITLEESVASTYLEAHKSVKQFVNKPLPYWEDLQLIMGDDASTACGAKSVHDDIGEAGNEKGSCASLDDVMIDCTLGSDDIDGASESSPSSMKRRAVGTSSAFKPRRRRNDNNERETPSIVRETEREMTVEKAMEDVIQAASGAHFSGLRLDSMRLSSPTTPSSPSARAHAAAAASSSARPDDAASDDTFRQPFLIGVSGGTASGKTTVCDMIIQQLHDHRVVLVNQDSFYRGLTAEESERVNEYNFDHPDAFDTEQLLECIGKLKCGQSVNVPIYDFKNHRRCSESFRKVNASDVIILEGILVFHDPQVRNMMDMKIFVDTDADVRLARRIRRDTVERGRDVNSVLEQYAKFVKPAFDDFVLPLKKYADVIIPRGGDNHVAIDLIVQHIRTKLGLHDLCKIYPNVFVIQSTFQIRGMHTLIRDRAITTPDFVFYSDRLIRLVVEHGLGHLPFTEKQVVTPTGSIYMGVDFCKKLCGVSIIRSGESMENALRACCKGIKIGKILIHRDGDNGKQLIYEKLPNDISERHVLLLDPVLATGNSANKAIEVLIQKGVPENRIIFLNLISAPEGIHCVCTRFPSLKIVTSEIDVALNEEYRVIPGLGEFGDRYFGTDEC